MFFRFVAAVSVFAGLNAWAPGISAQDGGITAEDVLNAIDAGVEFLKKACSRPSAPSLRTSGVMGEERS